jgi:NADH-quinone oxidoreductase subunit E
MGFEEVDSILQKYKYQHQSLISMMQDIQRVKNYLPSDTLRYISQKLEIPLSQIYHIATFYKSFSLKPRGRHIIRVCLGTACHLSGAVKNREQIERLLHIDDGETTQDGLFSLETVNCLGTCALAPVTMVNEDYYAALTPGKIDTILSIYVRPSGSMENDKD